MMDNEQHHWIGVKPTPATQWGFIYCITHLPTGKKYIGKKAYRASVGPKPKMKPRSLKLPTFREWHWKENNWRYYSGSSKYLTAFKKTTKKEDWEHEILTQCDNSMDLHYQEIEYLVWNQALTLVDEEGEYVFFNRAIPGIKFRPPEVRTDAHNAKISQKMMGNTNGVGHGRPPVDPDKPCVKCGSSEWGYKKTGTRRCRVCDRATQKRQYARKKAAKAGEDSQ